MNPKLAHPPFSCLLLTPVLHVCGHVSYRFELPESGEAMARLRAEPCWRCDPNYDPFQLEEPKR